MSASAGATEAMIERVAPRIEGAPTVHRWERMPSGYANANYRLETSSGWFLLRHCTGRDISEVEFELNVLDWLDAHAFPAPKALAFSGGDRWILCPEKSPVALMEWLDGSEPEPNHASGAATARALADLHRLPQPSGDWWRRENPIGTRAASRLVDDARSVSHDLVRFFAEEFASMREQLEGPLPSGLVHGDIFPDNTLFDGGQLAAILDFECACEDALLFDVAMTVHGFCFPDEQWSPDLAERFVTRYAERRPLTDAEAEAFPAYLRWCPLAMMGWHLRQLLGRPNARNEKRATELARRVTAMKRVRWNPCQE